MSRPENSGQPLSNPEDTVMVTPRKNFYVKIMRLLKEKGGQTEEEMWKAVNPPKKQKRTFSRALKDLQKFELVSEEDEENRVSLIGYEPGTIEFSVGVRHLRLTMPFEKSAAKRLLNKRPVLKHLITHREGLMYEILTGAGLLENNTHQK